MQYFLFRSGQREGPFEEAALRAMLARGEITAGDQVWRQGMSAWESAGAHFGGSPPPMPTTRGPAAKAAGPKLHVALWVVLAVVAFLGVGVLVITLVARGVRQAMVEEGSKAVSYKPLFEDRAGHQTAWTKAKEFEADGPAEKPPAGTFDIIRYNAPAGKLAAYLTPDPKDGKKHPAVVWAHGGFGGIGDFLWDPPEIYNDQSARAFREKGIVLMLPSWRGENDNPGRFELFYGEVEDLLAAVDHVRALPYVDPSRVYLAGHSSGGTLVLLAATASDKFRATFSIGGMPEGAFNLMIGHSGYIPYQSNFERENRLRCPSRYVRFIRRPTFYFEGGDEEDHYVYAAKSMERAATEAKAPFRAFGLPGDHFTIIHPVTNLLAQKILQDTGPECGISFTQTELNHAIEEAFSGSVGNVVKKWLQDGGDLAKTIKALKGGDEVVRSTDDVKIIAQAAKRLASTPVAQEPMNQMSALASLRHDIDDDDLLEAFDKAIGPTAVAWLRPRVSAGAPADQKEAESCIYLLSDIAQTSHKPATELLIQAAQSGFAAGSDAWGIAFSSFDSEHPHLGFLLLEFKKKLPAGDIAPALLRAINSAHFDDGELTHSFDSPEGRKALQSFLERKTDNEDGTAHNAAVALAFISTEHRKALLPLAMQHPEVGVQMEAAWADLKHGGSEGLSFLKKACLDVHQSVRAQSYLKELKRDKDVPRLEPEFAAKAEMSNWLQHPNELDQQPLTMEVMDHRELYWPPDKEKKHLWIIRFTYRFEKDDPPSTGYGMVGGMTWSSFDDEDEKTPPTPEALYIRHCSIEMDHDSKEDSSKENDKSAKLEKARAALAKGNPGVFGKK